MREQHRRVENSTKPDWAPAPKARSSKPRDNSRAYCDNLAVAGLTDELEARRRELTEAEAELDEFEGRAPQASPPKLLQAAKQRFDYRTEDLTARHKHELQQLDGKLANVRIDLAIARSRRVHKQLPWRRWTLGAFALSAPPGILYFVFANAGLSFAALLMSAFGVFLWRLLEVGDDDPPIGTPPARF